MEATRQRRGFWTTFRKGHRPDFVFLAPEQLANGAVAGALAADDRPITPSPPFKTACDCRGTGPRPQALALADTREIIVQPDGAVEVTGDVIDAATRATALVEGRRAVERARGQRHGGLRPTPGVPVEVLARILR